VTETPDEAALGRCREICAAFGEAPFYRLLGFRAFSDAPGTARVELPFRPELVQLYGGIHGGALLALADAAVNIALATAGALSMAPGEDGAGRQATVQLSMHFLAPAGQRDVVARSQVTRRGGRVGFAECVLRAGEDEIARAQGICHFSASTPKR
jgi:uncharacterized protein (TIGR00369 family)